MDKEGIYNAIYPPIYKNVMWLRLSRVIGWILSVGTIWLVGLGILVFIVYFGLIERLLVFIVYDNWNYPKHGTRKLPGWLK